MLEKQIEKYFTDKLKKLGCIKNYGLQRGFIKK